MKAFSINEMENIFEIGRAMQHVVDFEDGYAIEDSKNAFLFAARLAMEFEEKHHDTEEYYSDLDDFITDKIMEELKVES